MIYEDLIVTLEPWELLQAATEAARRWAESEARGAQDRGNVERDLGKDVAGVCGEIAVAKWTRRYWTAGEQGAGDVGGLEVRTRRADCRNESPKLLIQPYEEQKRRDTPFILVVGQRTQYRLVGYTTPRRARELVNVGGATIEDPGNRGRPCIAIEQIGLLPLDQFRNVDVLPYLEAA